MKYQLTGAEKQSCRDRVRHAEGLITQLPMDHDGRNTWLLNFGTGDEAEQRRKERGIGWNPITQAAPTSGELTTIAVATIASAAQREPAPGSRWTHHSGRVYTVLFLTNEPDSDKPEYPRTVVYVGAVNGKLWSGPLSDWHRRMTEIV